MSNHFIQCCARWAKSVSPKGKIWFWLLFLPFTGPLVFVAGGETYGVVARLSAVGLATLVAIWVSYLIRGYFDEDMELLLFRQMVDKADQEGGDRASILLSRAVMIAASWLARAIVLIGFLWAVVIAFRADYVV